jgi:hypothetical protein
MPWSGSGWQACWMSLCLGSANSNNSLIGHPVKTALWGDNTTPYVTAQNAGYNLGCYPANIEIRSPPGWPVAGQQIPNLTVTIAGEQIVVNGDPVISAGPVTFPPGLVFAPVGSMMYDDAATLPSGVQKVAFAYHWFGGPVPVRAGRFILIWGPAGIATMGCPLRTVNA